MTPYHFLTSHHITSYDRKEFGILSAHKKTATVLLAAGFAVTGLSSAPATADEVVAETSEQVAEGLLLAEEGNNLEEEGNNAEDKGEVLDEDPIAPIDVVPITPPNTPEDPEDPEPTPAPSEDAEPEEPTDPTDPALPVEPIEDSETPAPSPTPVPVETVNPEEPSPTEEPSAPVSADATEPVASEAELPAEAPIGSDSTAVSEVAAPPQVDEAQNIILYGTVTERSTNEITGQSTIVTEQTTAEGHQMTTEYVTDPVVNQTTVRQTVTDGTTGSLTVTERTVPATTFKAGGAATVATAQNSNITPVKNSTHPAAWFAGLLAVGLGIGAVIMYRHPKKSA